MKQYLHTEVLCAGLSLLLLSGQAFAQLSAIPTEFTGSATETFEELSRVNVQALVNVEVPIFSGLATISGPNEYIWLNGTQLGYPGTFGLGYYNARAHDGNQGYGTSLAYATSRITFNTPISGFGGYWGCASTTTPMVFAFYDANGASIGSASVVYSAPNHDGTLEWFGWQSSVPIGRIEYSGTWVVNDSLRLQVVPEANCAVLFSTGLALWLARRRGKLAEEAHFIGSGLAHSNSVSGRHPLVQHRGNAQCS